MARENIEIIEPNESDTFGFVIVRNLNENKEYRTSKIDIKLLTKALKVMKELDNKHVLISVGEDDVLFFRSSKDSKLALAIAPRVD